MKKTIRFRLPLLLLCTALFLSACSGPKTTPQNVIAAICEAENGLPAGRLYVLSAPTDDEKHPSESWLGAMFGNGKVPSAFDLVEDAAFFTSYTEPCEFAAFLCKTKDATQAVSEVCLHRLHSLKLYREGEKDSAPLQNAGVTVRGKWVILYVCKDPQGVLRAIRRTL